MNTQLETYTKTAIGDYVVPIGEAADKKGKYSEAYPLGFPLLDSAMIADGETRGGVRAGDLVVITGISGSGKTTFAQNITMNLDKEGFASLWFSFEVIINNLYAKFISMGLKDESLVFVPKKIQTGNLKWIKEKIIEAKKKYLANMVVIDHLDFLSPTDRNNSDQYRMVLKNICTELKNLAIEEEVVVFLMAHTKKVQGREVEMQDIGESSGIYQLADYVMSVSRAVQKEIVAGQEITTATDEGIVKILKNRFNGKEHFMYYKMVNNKIIPQ